MTILLKELPWSEDAFEPVISAKTVFHHYHKHHKGYVDKLNGLLIDEGMGDMSLEQVLTEYANRDGTGKVIWNNAAQHFNHAFYWESITPENQRQQDATLKAMIDSAFGDIQFFKNQFATACITLFGSGWVWLTYDGKQLHIEKTSNAEQPKYSPLLVMDVWEHAYYLDYQQDRKKHVEELLNFLDFARAAERLEKLVK